MVGLESVASDTLLHPNCYASHISEAGSVTVKVCFEAAARVAAAEAEDGTVAVENSAEGAGAEN